jgi:hypothetical protein
MKLKPRKQSTCMGNVETLLRTGLHHNVVTEEQERTVDNKRQRNHFEVLVNMYS